MGELWNRLLNEVPAEAAFAILLLLAYAFMITWAYWSERRSQNQLVRDYTAALVAQTAAQVEGTEVERQLVTSIGELTQRIASLERESIRGDR